MTDSEREVWESVWALLETGGDKRDILSTMLRSICLTALGNGMTGKQIAAVMHELANDLEEKANLQ